MRPRQHARRRFVRLVIALGSVVAMTVALAGPTAASLRSYPVLTDQPYHSVGSGIDGAGGTSVVVADPRHPQVLLAGQDTSGIWRSTDSGAHWRSTTLPSLPPKSPFAVPPGRQVASIVFDPADSAIVYAAVGHSGERGGVLRSTDNGRTWASFSVAGQQPQFAGSRPGHNMPDIPRSTGTLMAFGPNSDSSRSMYAGSFERGVYTTSLTGPPSWTQLCPSSALAHNLVRGIAISGSTLYVAAASFPSQTGAPSPPIGEHVWTVDLQDNSCTQLTDSPQLVEELWVDGGGTVWAAAAEAGVFSMSPGTGTWTRHPIAGTPQDGKTPYLISITGEGNTIYAGSQNPAEDPSRPGVYQTVMRSTDGGQHWENFATDWSSSIVGNSGVQWWQPGVSESHPAGMSSFPGNLMVSNGYLYTAGRGGMWRRATSSSGDPNWYPSAHGMNVTFDWDVEIDPNMPHRMYVGDTDWSLLVSDDGLRTVDHAVRMIDVALDVRDIALLPGSGHGQLSTVFVATEFSSKVQPEGGGIYRQAVDGTFESLELPHEQCAESATGVAVLQDANVVVAAVQGCGLYRRGAGSTGSTWRKVLSSTLPGKRTPIVIGPGRQLYVYDRSQGLLESTDAGRSFSRIGGSLLGVSGEIGDAAVVPGVDGQLFVVNDTGLYQVVRSAGKWTSTSIEPTEPTDTFVPATVAVSGTDLFVGDWTGAGVSVPHLYHAAITGRGDVRLSGLRDVADAQYRALAFKPRAMNIGMDGTLYVATAGNGVVIVRAGRNCTRGCAGPPWMGR